MPRDLKLEERIPRGEQGAGFRALAVSPTRDTVSTCGASIRFAAVEYIETDPKLDSAQLRDSVSKAVRGVDAAEVTWTEETRTGPDYGGAYELPADRRGSPPAKGWFTLREKDGRTSWYILETDPDTWNALARTFQDSGKHLVIVPRRK